jgi:PTS system beta-glucosides-specific IIC component
LNQIAGPVGTALICATGFWLSVTGIGRPIFFVCMGMLFANGVEYAYMPYAMVVANFLSMGVSLGYAIRVRNKDKKQLGITCFISTLLGGVSEPTTFGIALPNKKTYLPMFIGGAVAGLYMGITKVGYYQFGPSNVLSVIGFISQNSSNLINGCISAGLAFAVTFVLMLVFFKEEEA